jgi:hypothetical protein
MKTLQERFEAKVHHEPMSGCWLWGGYANVKGYGQIRLGRARDGLAQATEVAVLLYRNETVLEGMDVGGPRTNTRPYLGRRP